LAGGAKLGGETIWGNCPRPNCPQTSALPTHISLPNCPRNLGLAPTFQHIGANGAFCGLQNTPKCVSGRQSAQDPVRRAHDALPDSPSWLGWDTLPYPTPIGDFGASILPPSAPRFGEGHCPYQIFSSRTAPVLLVLLDIFTAGDFSLITVHRDTHRRALLNSCLTYVSNRASTFVNPYYFLLKIEHTAACLGIGFFKLKDPLVVTQRELQIRGLAVADGRRNAWCKLKQTAAAATVDSRI